MSKVRRTRRTLQKNMKSVRRAPVIAAQKPSSESGMMTLPIAMSVTYGSSIRWRLPTASSTVRTPP